MTHEGSFSEFLGIKFVHDKETGAITAMQQGLIKKILAATAMEDCNPNWVPAAPITLGIDPDGEPMDEEWSYPSHGSYGDWHFGIHVCVTCDIKQNSQKSK